EDDVRGPATGELARLRREPLRARGLVEAFDGEHAISPGNDSAVRDCGAVAIQWRGDQCPDAVGDPLEIAEWLTCHHRAERRACPERAERGGRDRGNEGEMRGT